MILHRLIPNITQLENSLNSFADMLDADEVLLFERRTFLVCCTCGVYTSLRLSIIKLYIQCKLYVKYIQLINNCQSTYLCSN